MADDDDEQLHDYDDDQFHLSCRRYVDEDDVLFHVSCLLHFHFYDDCVVIVVVLVVIVLSCHNGKTFDFNNLNF